MDEPGQLLRQTRERLGLKFRDVEDFSLRIAELRKNSEYYIAISRLSDIENRGIVPSIFRLYTLGAAYRLDLAELLRWYGVDPGFLAADSTLIAPPRTHLHSIGHHPLEAFPSGLVQVPLTLDPGVDLRRTTFLSRFIQNWGMLPLMLVAGLELKHHRYAFIGLEDFFMYPLLMPGSLLLIDESRRTIAPGGWSSESDRPIYFLEHREGWLCAWCSLQNKTLVALPHPASAAAPISFAYPADVDIIGQVSGVANRLDPSRRPPTRS